MIEQILKYTGVELPEGKTVEDFTIDDFKKAFDSRYVTKENAVRDEEVKSKIVGEVLGATQTKLKRTFKEYGIEVEGDNILDLSADFAKKQNELYQKQVEELKGKGGKDIEEKFKEKLQAKEGEISNLQKMLESKDSELNNKLNEFKETQKNSQLQSYKSQLFGGLKFSENVNEYTKKGFYSDFAEKYKLDIDETGNKLITNAKGERIPNPEKHGEFMSPEQVLNVEFEKANLGVKNPSQPPQTREVKTIAPNGNVKRVAKALKPASKF
jgi:hypothetical protein